jgi:hypothetical protein
MHKRPADESAQNSHNGDHQEVFRLAVHLFSS